MTTRDVDHFRTFGFVVWRQLLSADEVKAVECELMTVMETAHRAKPFDGSERHWLPLLSPNAPVIAGLAEDPRFYSKAQELVGGDVVLFIADGNRYVSDTGWHPDGTVGARGVKFFVYLGTLGPDTGALRVIPGSHHDPLHSAVQAYASSHGPAVEDVPSYAFDCEPGDVLAFDFPMWHASIGGSCDRRMCTIEYYRKPETEQDAAEVKGHFDVVSRVSDETFHRDGFPFFDTNWIDDPEQTATRREIVANMRAAGLLEKYEVGAAAGRL